MAPESDNRPEPQERIASASRSALRSGFAEGSASEHNEAWPSSSAAARCSLKKNMFLKILSAKDVQVNPLRK